MSAEDRDKNRGEAKGSRFGALREAWDEFRRFTRQELWDVDLSTLPRLRKFGLSLLRIGVLVWKGLAADNCGLQASALTYITLMSLVPVLALMFSVSKGLGAQQKIMETIGVRKAPVEQVKAGESAASAAQGDAGGESPVVAAVAGSQEGGIFVVVPGSRIAEFPPQLQRAIVQVFQYVDETDFSKLGVAGSLLLVFTVIKVMGKIEKTFNTIWGVREERSFHRKFADYVSVLVVVPLLLLATMSLTTALSSGRIVDLLRAHVGPLYWVYTRIIKLSGIVMLCAGFAFLYSFMPNTRVRLFPALAGGVAGGILWAMAQFGYINGQIGLTRYNAIYGTFAAIPIFLFWVYLSWLIVLFGAEVSFAVQNHRTYVLERAVTETAFATRELLGFVVMYEVCKWFTEHGGPWDVLEFSHRHGIPLRLTLDVIHTLTEAGLLVRSVNGEETVVPGRDPAKIDLWEIEKAFRGKADGTVELLLRDPKNPLSGILSEWGEQVQRGLAGKTMEEVLRTTA